MHRKRVQQVSDDDAYETLPSTAEVTLQSQSWASPMTRQRNLPPIPPARASTLPRAARLEQKICNSVTPRYKSDEEKLLKATVQRSLSDNKGSLSCSESCQLSDFISRHSNLLPFCVKVCNGFCSSATDLSISQNEIFNLHFVKHTKVVVMKDSEGREEYSVPVNSSVPFGIVYNPVQKEKRALEGFHFETVGDILRMKPLPTVISATKAYHSNSLETSVEANEILLIKGVTTRSTLRGRGKLLKVYSLKHGAKQLTEKCAGGFSTKPCSVKMHLSTMIEHSILFPQKAVLIADHQIDAVLSSSMATLPVILEKVKGETSVIATSAEEEGTENGVKLDISSDLDVQVEAVSITETEESLLQENSQSLYNSFDISTLQIVIDKPSSRAYELQCLLYKKLRHGKEMDGMQLVLPSLLQPQDDSFNETYEDTKPHVLQPHSMPLQVSPSPSLDPATSLSTQPARSLSTQPARSLSTQPARSLSTQPARSLSTQPARSLSTRPARSLSIDPARSPSIEPARSLSLEPARSLSLESEASSPEQENLYEIIQTERLGQSDGEYIDMKPDDEPMQHVTKVLERVNEINYNCQTIEMQIAQMADHVEQLATRVDELMQTVEVLKSEQQQLASKADGIDTLRSWCTSLQEEIKQIQSKPSPLPRPSYNAARVASSPATTPEENKVFISSLDCQRVHSIT